MGYGKSYLLAAMVCRITSHVAGSIPVVYIPDCGECLKDPVNYIRAALLFTWANDSGVQDTIMALQTMDEIEEILNGRHMSKGIIFVMDRWKLWHRNRILTRKLM